LSIRHYQVDPASVEEIIRRVQTTFTPVIRRAPGFVAFYAVDGGEGRITSISIFEDKAGAEASVPLAAEHIRQHLAGLFPTPPQLVAGEVRVAEHTSSGARTPA
jgi:hypothetical protein